MIKTTLILSLLVCMSFSQVDYRQFALDDFDKIVNAFSSSKNYHISYSYERFYENELVQSSKGENLRFNNFYFTAFDSSVNLSTNTRDLVVDFGEKVMTYKYGYEVEAFDRRMAKMLTDIQGTIENAVEVSYTEIDLELGKYTLLVTQGNTWKVEYEVNKVHHSLDKAHFYNYHPAEDLNEQIVITYTKEPGKPKLKDQRYDFEHYLEVGGKKVTVSDQFSDYQLQSLRIR